MKSDNRSSLKKKFYYKIHHLAYGCKFKTCVTSGIPHPGIYKPVQAGKYTGLKNKIIKTQKKSTIMHVTSQVSCPMLAFK